jgi:hypothetical protein
MAMSDFFSSLWLLLRHITTVNLVLGALLLLISPRARVNADDAVPLVLDLLRESIARIRFPWLKYEQLKQRYTNLKQRFINLKQAYTSLKREFDTIFAEKVKSDGHAQKLSNQNDRISRQLSYCQKQSEESSVYQARLKLECRVKELELEAEKNDRHYRSLEEKNVKLEQALAKKESTLQAALREGKATVAREREAQDLSEALKAALKQQKNEHKTVLYHKNRVVMLHQRVVEVLHQLAEQTSAQELSAAITFARALQHAGINTSALGIQERRFEILSEFVYSGMGPGLVIQPQQYERGFRFIPKTVSELEAKPGNVLIINLRRLAEGIQQPNFAYNGEFGPFSPARHIPAVTFHKSAHQIMTPAINCYSAPPAVIPVAEDCSASDFSIRGAATSNTNSTNGAPLRAETSFVPTPAPSTSQTGAFGVSGSSSAGPANIVMTLPTSSSRPGTFGTSSVPRATPSSQPATPTSGASAPRRAGPTSFTMTLPASSSRPGTFGTSHARRRR